MTHQPLLRRIIRIRICTVKPQFPIPLLRRRLIPRPQRTNLPLRSQTSGFRRLICTTNISQLVTNSIRDDIRIERFLLSFINQGVDGLECEFCGFASVEAGFEFHRGGAEAEVEAGNGGFGGGGVIG